MRAKISNLTNSWAGSFGFTYDALSRRTQMTRPNGVNTNYSYDSLSRLLSVLHQAGGSTIDGCREKILCHADGPTLWSLTLRLSRDDLFDVEDLASFVRHQHAQAHTHRWAGFGQFFVETWGRNLGTKAGDETWGRKLGTKPGNLGTDGTFPDILR